MKAGIDLGTSGVKLAWQAENASYRFSTCGHEELEERLADLGVMRLRYTGIGGAMPPGYPASGPPDDPIADEIALQADGAKRLFGWQDGPQGDFLLVSVGTGTSYTLVPASGEPRRFPIGNAIGGGFIAGLAAMQVLDVSEVEGHASRGAPLDLLVKDLVPAASGTLQGEFVVSHFGKIGVPRFTPEELADGADPLDDLCATIVHCAAVTVIRDVLVLGMVPGFAADDVVFIGTPVAKLASLRGHVARYASALGKRAWFPEKGEYAAALGALHAD